MSSASWWNESFEPQSGIFTIDFDATPSANGIDAVFGLGAGPIDHWSDLAAAIRFAPDGFIDARAGDGYRADTPYAYQAGVTYHLRFDVDVTARRYIAWVLAPGATRYTLIGMAYPFRTEHAAITGLDRVAGFVDETTGASGTVDACYVSVVRSPLTGDGCIARTPGDGFASADYGPVDTAMVVDTRVRAMANGMDAVIGVGSTPVDDYNDLAVAVRFWTDGTIQARDGATYRADQVVTYELGREYQLRFVIDLPSKTYSVFVAAGDARIELGRDYAFRPQQLGAGSVRHVATIVEPAPGGRLDVCETIGARAWEAMYVRRGASGALPLPGNRALIREGTSTSVYDAAGVKRHSIARAGAWAADMVTGDIYLVRVESGLLVIDALTPALVPRWTRQYGMGPGLAIGPMVVYEGGDLAIAFVGANQTRVERFRSDGTGLGGYDLGPGALVSLFAGGYVVHRLDSMPRRFESYTITGELRWSTTVPGTFSVDELATGPDGSFVFTGRHSEPVQFGTYQVPYLSSPDADNTFAASFSPTGEARMGYFTDSTWSGGLATNGHRMVVGRQKSHGFVINDYLVHEVDGTFVRIFYGPGLGHFGRSHGVTIAPSNRIFATAEMNWPGPHDGRWLYTIALAP